MTRTTSMTIGRDERFSAESATTMIGELVAVGRELDESELLAVTGGSHEPVIGDPTGGSCGGCH